MIEPARRAAAGAVAAAASNWLRSAATLSPTNPPTKLFAPAVTAPMA